VKTDWESHLDRWTTAGVLDVTSANRIRAWEAEPERSHGFQWPILVALAFGALLLGAGVLLFVSAHWDELSPAQRVSLVVLMVAVFHAGGAWAAQSFEGLSIALHTVGTFALGAGIALTGQIFNLSEHWPAAIMLWAFGAVAAWYLLRHWTQAALAALLVPYWLAAEWTLQMEQLHHSFYQPIAAGICALSFTYLSARQGPADHSVRKALGWIGGIALLPSAMVTAVYSSDNRPTEFLQYLALTIAVVLPLALSVVLRRGEAIWNAAAIGWTMVLLAVGGVHGDRLPVYIWGSLGAIGLVAWGVRDSRPERINLGMAGFAATVLAFYFSSVMDKLGRSASLILLGLIFLGGGWFLEKTRRQLIAGIRPREAL
jgi:uncharacterized membrane protein